MPYPTATFLISQKTAYPTPSPKGSMIHGRHSGVSLNFQAKTPTAKRPNMAPMILAIIIYSPAPSTPSHI